VQHSERKPKTRKRTVSLTIDPELYAQAKNLGVNASRIAEEALTQEVARRRAEALAAEIRADLEAANDYVARNGSYAELARAHFSAKDDGAV
jgi:post-segregation antitoxin (ccd killing protein)